MSQAIKDTFTAGGQEQVFRFEDQLTQSDKDALYSQLEGIDLQYSLDVFKRSTEADHSASHELAPFPTVDRVADKDEATLGKWQSTTLQAVAEGKVAFILLAGGQGTRLGSSDPKGMYNIGMPSGKCLFQFQAERLHKLELMAAEKVPGSSPLIMWYLMTSPATHAPTVAFFEKMDYFCLKKEQVFFFQQATFPCFDFDGKMMLETTSKVGASPDGNGGIYKALDKSGALKSMDEKGVEFVYACSVDNALAKVCDPHFLGYCIEKESDCAVKVLPKAYAEEKVGVVCLSDGKPSVVEYSDMSEEQCAQINPDTGALMFNTGNICIHFYTKAFLDMAHTLQLPYHVAKKKIKFVDDKGTTVSPDSITGMKMEQFIFDVLPFAKNMAVLEGVREQDFAPVKNAPGNPRDSPDTARQLLSDLHKSWATKVGATFTNPDELYEISPLVSYGGEGLNDKFTAPVTLPASLS